MRLPEWMREAVDGYRWLWRAHVRWRPGPRWCSAVEFGLDVMGDLARAALAALEACANPSFGPVPLAVTPTGRSAMTIPFDSANERLKAGFDSWMWISMMAAVLVHFATFAYWPEMSVTAGDRGGTVIDILPPLPPIDIPDAPEPLARPALPIISSVDLAEDVTIGKTTFDQNPVSELPPPPTRIEPVASGPGIVMFTIPPRILNPDEVVRALQRVYPSVLRNSGIGDTVRVQFSIDEEGRVLDTSITRGSSYQAFDAAALAVADVIRFSPAWNRDQKVAVSVVFPIVFEVVGTRQ